MRTMLVLLFAGCAATSHPTSPSNFGTPTTTMEQTLDTPGPLTVETVATADWQVQLSGVLNLERAKLAERDEPIQIFAHVIRHPTRGVFLIDTGVERDLRDVSWLPKKALGDTMKSREDTAALAARLGRVDGVFLTHIHLDHVLGLPDLAATTPIYAGRGDAQHSNVMNMLTRGTFDALFAGKAPVQELRDEVLDLFGDGSLFALPAKGHTPGSTAYIARTAEGPVLFTGDACHTRYGWENSIEPGTFSEDQAASRETLLALKALSARHPSMQVRLGHQR